MVIRFLLYMFIFSISTYINAQMCFFPGRARDIKSLSFVDSGRLRIWYVLNATKKLSKGDDIHILEIGDNVSKYYSYNVFLMDSLSTYYMINNPNSSCIPHFVKPSDARKYLWSEIYKDLKNNKLIEYAHMPLYISDCKYSEEIPDFRWEICNDTLYIKNKLCQKAICSFRGRRYIAWFCKELNWSNGPWKFGGLPGVILKIYDLDKEYVYECVGIENDKEKISIKSYDYNNYNDIERTDLLKLWNDIFDHYFLMIGGSNKLQCTDKYNPLELE
ncbi:MULTISPECIES: GLPGLI family protein [Parabacteroides]|uniref:GLPGLI family protein n=1 Tax=Parabacteroides TaxID=375288 RepID=UPI000F00CF31|nr:GLPGLI family protein [Parabacteroides sp. AF18-52]RHR35447.1 GLPGLI family protein [Parabacteroides sp. AF18-52]